jgi:hypothetical protein
MMAKMKSVSGLGMKFHLPRRRAEAEPEPAAVAQRVQRLQQLVAVPERVRLGSSQPVMRAMR